MRTSGVFTIYTLWTIHKSSITRMSFGVRRTLHIDPFKEQQNTFWGKWRIAMLTQRFRKYFAGTPRVSQYSTRLLIESDARAKYCKSVSKPIGPRWSFVRISMTWISWETAVRVFSCRRRSQMYSVVLSVFFSTDNECTRRQRPRRHRTK